MFCMSRIAKYTQSERTDAYVHLQLILTLNQTAFVIWRGKRSSVLSFLHSFAIWFL